MVIFLNHQCSSTAKQVMKDRNRTS